ncbi:hypothetical protein NITHO_40009 [Nitrolancea hollandica Lb]|uniref:Uncharacterized protein n=1 Tax=Nitrolancea hollandica Lb TaxID=1129897 RepID=I4EJF3_9BACT|nr:hypothetical protein NITHO_40009 [Nitrolancea hollandica Lb]
MRCGAHLTFREMQPIADLECAAERGGLIGSAERREACELQHHRKDREGPPVRRGTRPRPD